jgi:predicted nucleic acid-binding protein
VTVLVDSDILIEVSRGRNATILTEWENLARSDSRILYTPVTACELWAGARPSEFEALSALFEVLECAATDYQTGQKAGEYIRQFRKSHKLELGDASIASAAWHSGAALWTRNRKHYPMKDITFFPDCQ